MSLKKLFLSFTSLAGSVFSVAAEDQVELKSFGRYIQPCKYWRYESSVNGYVCSSYDNFEAATQRDLDRLERRVDDLESRVDDLEKRVTKLESPTDP